MHAKDLHLNERAGTISSNVYRCVKLLAAILLSLPIACQENKNDTQRAESPKKDPTEDTIKKAHGDRTVTLENACLALQRDLDIPHDSSLWKCLQKREFTFDKVSGYYSACGFLDLNLSERVFYINRGPVPKGAPDIKGTFYFTPDGIVKARRETP